MVLYMKKELYGFIPYDKFEEDYESLKYEEYKCVLTQPRDNGFHKKFIVFLKYLYLIKQTKHPISFYSFRKEVVRLAGFTQPYETLEGEIRDEAKSIAFSNMDGIEFAELFNRCIDVGLLYFITPDMENDVREKAQNIILSFSG